MKNATHDKHIMTDVQVAELAIHLIASLALGVSCVADQLVTASFQVLYNPTATPGSTQGLKRVGIADM